MKKYLLTTLAILAIPFMALGVTAFNSAQVGSGPSNGEVLQTNGSISTWVGTSTLGIRGLPCGTNGQLQYNQNGACGGADITYGTSSSGLGNRFLSFSTSSQNLIRYYPTTNVFQWYSDYNQQIYAAGSNGVDITAANGSQAFNAINNGADQPFVFTQMDTGDSAIIFPSGFSSFKSLYGTETIAVGDSETGAIGVGTQSPTASIEIRQETPSLLVTDGNYGARMTVGSAGMLLEGTDGGAFDQKLRFDNGDGNIVINNGPLDVNFSMSGGVGGTPAMIVSNPTGSSLYSGLLFQNINPNQTAFGFQTNTSGSLNNNWSMGVDGSDTGGTNFFLYDQMGSGFNLFANPSGSTPRVYIGKSSDDGTNATLQVGDSFSLPGKYFDSTFSGGSNGMVLQSTGSATIWVATTSLGISGGASLSGGSTNAMTYWTSPTTVGATSSPTVGYITATTTTPSRFTNASTTNVTVATALTLPSIVSSFVATDATGKLIATSTPSCGTGSINTLMYWVTSTTCAATSSPTVGYITATSTTIASQLPFASTTGITATNLFTSKTALSSAGSMYGANGINWSGAGSLNMSASASQADFVFTGNPSNGSGKTILYLNQSGAGNDNKLWAFDAEGGDLYGSAIGDTFSGGSNWLHVNHVSTGASTVKQVELMPGATSQATFTSTAVGIGSSTPSAMLSVMSGSGTGTAFAVATTTGRDIGGYDNDGHAFTGGVAPAISSCGTGTGTVVGDDQSGTITTATAATACTLTFAKAYKNTPVCVVTGNSLVGFADISSISTTAVTFGISSALTAGNLYYSCSYHR